MSMNMTSPVTIRPILLLLLLASIWSSSFAMIKIGVETIPPMTMAAVRICMAAMLLYAYARLKGMRLPADRKFWWLSFWMGLFGNALPFTLIGWGEQTIDSGLAAILMAVMPLSTLLLVHFFSSDEKLTPVKLMGMVVGFFGIVVLVGPESLKGLGSTVLPQVAVASAAFCYAIATTVAKNMKGVPPAISSTGLTIMGGGQMLLMSLAFEAPWALSPSTASSLATIYLGLFPTALATLIYFHLMTIRGAMFVSFNNYLIPGLGVMWGALFLGEHVSMQEILALGLILTGIFIASIRKKPATS